MRTIKTTHSMRAGLLVWPILIVCLMACALGAPGAWATYGDEFDLAAAEGPALPGPKAFWAGTCDLASAPPPEDTIPGGVGSRPDQVVTGSTIFGLTFGPAPAVPADCIDLGVPNITRTSQQPWVTPPSWRQAPVTQAGAHPDATAMFALTRDYTNQSKAAGGAMPAGSARDVQVNLPPGLVGNPHAVPQCTNAEFAQVPSACPSQSQVGVTNIQINFAIAILYMTRPVYNLEPLPGHAAEFGIPNVTFTSIRITGKARTDGDFGLSTGVERVPTGAPLLQQSLTFWGVPWAASHNIYRLKQGVEKEAVISPSGLEPSEQAPYEASWGPIEPFISNPTSCGGSAPVTTLFTDSWQSPAATLPDGEPNPDEPNWKSANSEAPPATGCAELGFDPAFSLQSSSTAADAPAGLSVDLSVPQNNTPPGGVASNPSDTEGAPAYWKTQAGLATSHLKDTTVTLPAGLVVNPSAASGLAACSEEQVGLTSESPVSFNNDEPACPDASKLGTVEVDTPLLSEPLLGTVYLASQDANPFHSLIALYLVVQNPERGLIVKLAGETALDPVSGQITARFLNNPQLPFEHVKLTLKGGPRAAVVNPTACGMYTATSDLVPWASPSIPDATPSSSFQVDQGCGTGGFAPAFTAGSSAPRAGGYSSFVVSFSRNDGEQNLAGVSVSLPPGLLGMISKVSPCGEPQASQGACPAASQIGTTTVTAGAGGSPLSLPETGQPVDPVFLTGPYGGAPFGLSILVHAQAGPFDLGNVIVRATISIDPHTAQVTVTSGELPHILDGVPLQLRSATVNVNRGEFIVNPTNCEPSNVAAAVASLQGAKAPVSSPFTAVNCASLKFTPKFSVSTSAKTSKAGGASLTTELIEPSEAQGSQANVAKVKVELPKALPSRLTTLQKACTAAQFEANPAGCPSGSKIGSATVNTPILPVPLSGPAIFVSHGGEAFPSLTLVLQGDGVTIDLVGTTFISKAGVTSTTFKTVPDAPFSTFTLTLPEGKYSALAANGNLCAQKLTMPTEFIAQNGAAIHQSTPIAVEGCSTSLSFTHTIKKKTLMLSVYAPAAGKVTASGKGLTTVSKAAKGQEDVTITLKQKQAGKLKTTVKVAFTPSTGKDRKKQAKSAKLRFKK